MQLDKIANSLDWQDVRNKLSKSKKNLGIFKRDIDLLLNGIDKEVTKLSNLEIEVRCRPSPSNTKRVEEQVEKVNQQIKTFNKYYMMALLTHC